MNLTASGSKVYLATFALRGSDVYLVICLCSLVSTPKRVPFLIQPLIAGDYCVSKTILNVDNEVLTAVLVDCFCNEITWFICFCRGMILNTNICSITFYRT